MGAENKTLGLNILLASGNRGKIGEYRALFDSYKLNVIALSELLEQGKKFVEPLENGLTFLENALLKARSYAEQSGFPTLADDSGLCVLALSGRPGVLSARYGGLKLTDSQRCEKLLLEMEGQKNRSAFFEVALVLVHPQKEEYLYWSGVLEGLITKVINGNNGFGYDPIFFHSPSGKTLAELSVGEKNSLSHRAMATKLLVSDIEKIKKFLSI
jgi:XTP/dITP diphosphohydrolase